MIEVIGLHDNFCKLSDVSKVPSTQITHLKTWFNRFLKNIRQVESASLLLLLLVVVVVVVDE